MRRTSEDPQTFSTIILFALNKNAIIKNVNSPITNSNNCTTLIATRPSSASFTPTTSINATIKVSAPLPILKTKSSKTFNFYISSKKTPISTCTSSKPSGVPSPKSIFLDNLAIKETSVPMLITSKIIAEIPTSINMNQSDASFGNFPMKSSPLKVQAVS